MPSSTSRGLNNDSCNTTITPGIVHRQTQRYPPQQPEITTMEKQHPDEQHNAKVQQQETIQPAPFRDRISFPGQKIIKYALLIIAIYYSIVIIANLYVVISTPPTPSRVHTLFNMTYPSPAQRTTTVIPILQTLSMNNNNGTNENNENNDKQNIKQPASTSNTHSPSTPYERSIYDMIKTCAVRRGFYINGTITLGINYHGDDTCTNKIPHQTPKHEPLPSLINPNMYPECHLAHLFLQNEFQLCPYDTSQVIEKKFIQQPTQFILDKFGHYLESHRVCSQDQSIAPPLLDWLIWPTSCNKIVDNVKNCTNSFLHDEMNHDTSPSDKITTAFNTSTTSTGISTTLAATTTTTTTTTTNTNTTTTSLLLPNPTNSIDQSISYICAQYLHYYAELHLPILEMHIQLIRSILGVYAKSGVKSIEGIDLKSRRPTILKDEPWYNVNYVRDALRAKIRLANFAQIKPILSFFLLHGYTIVQADYEKFIKPKGFWGWRPISVDLRYIRETNAPETVIGDAQDKIVPSFIRQFIAQLPSHLQSIIEKNHDIFFGDGEQSFLTMFKSLIGVDRFAFSNNNNNNSNNQNNHNQNFNYTNKINMDNSDTNINDKQRNCGNNNNHNQNNDNNNDQKNKINSPINTGFIIELYFVPHDMDIKETKYPNHILYENWRNKNSLPYFQDQMNIEYNNNNNGENSNGNSHIDQMNWRTHAEIAGAIYNATLKDHVSLHDICPYEIYPLWTDQISCLTIRWGEFINDSFTSGLSYTYALERWALRQSSLERQEEINGLFLHNDAGHTENNDDYNTSLLSADTNKNDNNNRNIQSPSEQSILSRTISDLEHKFTSYINSNLSICSIQCEEIWKKHTKNDQQWYMPPNTHDINNG